MPHPFGKLLTAFRARKSGLSQARLAEMAGYDPALLTRMAQGQKALTGPSGRQRVVCLIGVMHDEGILTSQAEADALLAAAGLPPLYLGLPLERTLLQQLRPGPTQ